MFTFFAPFIIRTALGLVLFITSFHQLVDRKPETIHRFVSLWPKYGAHFVWTTAILEIVTGLSLVAGFYTQYAALVCAILFFYALLSKKYREATNRHVTIYILMFGMALSLLITGAGAFAFDTPL